MTDASLNSQLRFRQQLLKSIVRAEFVKGVVLTESLKSGAVIQVHHLGQ